MFSQFGHIEEQILMRDPADGSSKGCAFIRFKNKEDALLAMRFLNGNVYIAGSDKPLEVRFAENKKKTHNPTETTPKTQPHMGATPHNPYAPTNPMTPNPMSVKMIFKENILFI